MQHIYERKRKRRRRRRKSRQKIITVIAGVMVFCGILIFWYPVISNHVAKRQQENVIFEYNKSVSDASKASIAEEWERALSYNENSENYMSVLNIEGDGVMGYIEIPKIDVRIPIYHGASEASLKKGAGHVEQTGLPIGKKGNHPVLTGHRGLPGAELFTRLDELKIGDRFSIYILDKMFVYEVDQITIVLPEEVGKIRAEIGKDIITLVTCTPYGVNTHRLLVRGERVVRMQEEVEDDEEVNVSKRNKIIIYLIILFTGMAIVLYPLITNKLYSHRVENQKDLFIKANNESIGKKDRLYTELQIQNRRIYAERQKGLSDAESYTEAKINLKLYGVENNTIGFISIPKMGIELPILLGASEENMKKGAVHLTETSYPIGGENTNSVIAAHRGYSEASMFRDIEKLEIGDLVYIENFREKLTYKVIQLRIIDPTDINEILIRKGKDMITLITCHPYRKNSSRYVVFCERV